MARLLVAAAAAVVVGYFSGSVQAGLQTFALVYGATGFLDPKQHILGPKLQDLKAPSATPGSPIAYIEGTPRLAGNYIWATPKREIATTVSQGKGGPGVDSTTYTYEIDCGVELSINEQQALRRVWSNGKLIWTVGDASDGQSIRDSGGIFVDIANKFIEGGQQTAWRAIRFYGGGPDQLPDPTYEAFVGVGNAPAYRGRSHVVIEGLNLGASGQLPVLTFEVCSSTTLAAIASVFGDLPGGGAGPTAFDTSGFQIHSETVVSGPAILVTVYDVSQAGVATQVGTYSNPYASSGRGQTDESGTFYWANADETNASYTFRTGPSGEDVYSFLLTADYLGDSQVRMCMRNESVVLGSQGFGLKRVYRFVKSQCFGLGHAPVVASAPLPTLVAGLATDETTLYALAQSSASIYVLDMATLTLQSTITAPGTTTGNGFILVDDQGSLFYGVDNNTLTSSSVYKWDPAALTWSLPYAIGGTELAMVFANAQVGIADGTVFVATAQTGFAPSGSVRVHAFQQTVAAADIPLDQVVQRLCLRTGQLTAGDIDVTALSGQVVHALAVSQVGPIRTTLEMLMAWYLFEFVETQGILKAVPRGGAPVLTIPYDDLGTSADGTAEPLAKKRVNDMEVAARVTVTYANVLDDFQNGSAQADRLVTESTAEKNIEFAIGGTPSEAKKVADANTMDLAVSLLSIGPIALPRKYAALEPTDVVQVTDADGSTFRLRLVKSTSGGGINTFDCVLDDASVISSTALADNTDNSSNLVRAVSATIARELDIPIARDADNDSGYYIQTKPAGDKWAGDTVFSSRDDVTYAPEVTITDRAIFGTCTTTLGDWTGRRVIDWLNTVTVDVAGDPLSSSTRAAILGDQTVNACAIGVNGRWELLQFINATFVSAGVYKLTGLLRGSRGTEWAMTGHAAGELFSLLTPAGMRRVEVESTLLGIPRYYRAVSIGKTLASATPDLFTDMGVGLKPFAPVRATVVRDVATGDITFGWKRRTRLAVRTTGPLGISVPLGEAAEAYSVDVFTDATYATVKRTIAASSTTAAYTGAQQTADFGSNQATVYFKVYQLSAAVGRGYELKAAA